MTTTTKTIREIQYLGPDGQPLEFVPGGPADPYSNGPTNGSGGGAYPGGPHQPVGYGDYEQYGQGGPPQPMPQTYADYGEYPHRPPTPPSPSDRSNSPPPQHAQPGRKSHFAYYSISIEFTRSPALILNYCIIRERQPGQFLRFLCRRCSEYFEGSANRQQTVSLSSILAFNACSVLGPFHLSPLSFPREHTINT